MGRAVSLFIVLFVFWFVMSGHVELWLVASGALAAALTVWLSARLESVDHEGHPVHLAWQGMLYWPWLLKEIVKANIDVAKSILASPAAIEPTLFTAKASQSDELGRVVYANSITLTPGTVTAGLEADGTLLVHALNRGSREGVECGDMDRRVVKLMGEA